MEAIQVIPFDKPEFGALVLLPERVKAWKIETDNLKLAADKFTASLPADLTSLTLESLTEYDTRLNNAIVKITSSFTRIETERKAGTSIIDEIKAYAMLPEKTVANLPGELKLHRDKIAREKARRAAALEAEKQLRIDKNNEAVEIAASQVSIINKNLASQISAVIKAMNDKFNSQTAAELEAYVKDKLTPYTPVLTDVCWSMIQKNGDGTAKHHTADEVSGIYQSVSDEYEPASKEEYTKKITAERDRLIELVPSRISELQDIEKDATLAQAALDRIKQEESERNARQQAEADEKQVALESKIAIDQMNNVFDAEATSETVSQAKGTQVKKKYVPNLPASWIPIIQSWVKNDLPICTPDEVAKKLSFMLTSANKRLNSGEVLTGVTVEDDYSTRSSKK